jgi:hypothetical protein
LPLYGRREGLPGRPDQASLALSELGGRADEASLLDKVIELFGDQAWTRSPESFHLELVNHSLREIGRYFVSVGRGSYELTRLGRAKAEVERGYISGASA